VSERDPFEVGIVLVAHGSRVDDANQDVHAVADRMRQRGFQRVCAAFLELARPGIREAAEHCVDLGARRVILVPYFLSAGSHVTEDLESHRRQLESQYSGVEFRLAPPLGPHPLLERIVCERVEQMVRD
jgi:sirohydrochlorin ferrochelatase